LVALELGDTCVELLEGKDLDDPLALQSGLQRAVADRNHSQVVLDLWRLEEITSAVVAVLVGTEARGAACGTPVAFACARHRVRRALAFLHKFLTIHGSVGLALEAIERRGREAAMDGERMADGQMEDGSRRFRFAQDGPPPGPSDDALAEAPPREEPGGLLGREAAVIAEQLDPGEETKEITGEITGEVTDDIAEGMAPPEAPAREVPESVMRRLSESAPELAEVLPREVEPAAATIFEDPVREGPAAAEEAPQEPPSAPSASARPVAKKRKAKKNKKKTARKKVSHKGKSRKKSSAKARSKPRKKSAKGRTKRKMKTRA